VPTTTGPESALSAILPDGVASACVDPEVEAFELHPEEAPFVAGALERRRREFACGRACARRAFADLGLPAPVIPSGAQREPIWPLGVVGSLTHTRGLCAAAVTTSARYRTLGLDVERERVFEAALIARVADESELEGANALGMERGALALVAFSAKEAVYKCQFPASGVYLGFHDVRLELEREGFRASLRVPAGPYGAGHGFRGRWLRSGGFVFTATWEEAQ
jgi:4'-phosphopantetheinyl transferase EntD